MLPLFCKSKLFNVKLSCVVRGMMDVLYLYCFKSVGIYKHKLSTIESIVILYWGINCMMDFYFMLSYSPDFLSLYLFPYCYRGRKPS